LRAADGGRALRLPLAPRPDLPRGVRRQGRGVGRTAPARLDAHRHAPRPPPVGAAVRVGIARSPGPAARDQGDCEPVILGLEFPPLSHIVNWPEFIGDDTWGINKVVLVYAMAAALTILMFR